MVIKTGSSQLYVPVDLPPAVSVASPASSGSFSQTSFVVGSVVTDIAVVDTVSGETHEANLSQQQDQAGVRAPKKRVVWRPDFLPLVLRRSLEGVGSGKLLDLGDGKLRPAGRQQALAKHRFGKVDWDGPLNARHSP